MHQEFGARLVLALKHKTRRNKLMTKPTILARIVCILLTIVSIQCYAFKVNTDFKTIESVPFCNKLRNGVDVCLIKAEINSLLAFDDKLVASYKTHYSKEGMQLLSDNCRLNASFIIDGKTQTTLVQVVTQAFTNKIPAQVSLNCTESALNYADPQKDIGFAGPYARNVTLNADSASH